MAALKSRLPLTASVRRDGEWKTLPAAELVPGDVVKLSLGSVVPADVTLAGGEILLDQSMLTGESVPIEAGAHVQTFAGALVRRGEALADVTATGIRTKFGRTAELVRTAHVVSYPAEGGPARRPQSRHVQWRSDRAAGRVRLCHRAPPRRDHTAHPDRHPGIDPGGSAGHLHLGISARCARPRKAQRAPDASLGGGRGGIDDGPVLRQDRHADAERADGDDRPCRARLRRGPRSGAGRAGQFRGRAGPGRRLHSRRRGRQDNFRRAETDRVRAVRSGDQNVRGDRKRARRWQATRREGRLCRGHPARAALSDNGDRGD